MERQVFASILVIFVISHILSWIILRKLRDLISKIFLGAMIFTLFLPITIILTANLRDTYVLPSLILLYIAFLAPEFGRHYRRMALDRRMERRIYDPHVVDFLVLFSMVWISVFLIVSCPNIVLLSTKSISQYIVQNPLRLIGMSFVWLLGENFPAEEIPLDYPYLPIILVLIFLSILLLVVGFLKAWFDKILLRLKHHRLKDKPQGLSLRDHAIIWGDRKLIKEIVREYIAKSQDIVRDIVLVSKKIRDMQFISVALSSLYTKLWVIEGDLGDPDISRLADTQTAHEMGIVSVYIEPEKTDKKTQSGESQNSSDCQIDNGYYTENEVIPIESLIAGVSEISTYRPQAQLCAVVPKEEHARTLRNVRILFRGGVGGIEEDFIESAEEIHKVLTKLVTQTPGIMDVLYDIFSYRNMGTISHISDIDIVPINFTPQEQRPFGKNKHIFFPLRINNKSQWFVIKGLKNIKIGEGACRIERAFLSLNPYSSKVLRVLNNQEATLAFSVCFKFTTIHEFFEGFEGSSLPKEKILYGRIYSRNFLLGETVLKNLRKIKKRSDIALILDIVDVPLFSTILVARGLLTDKGNLLFRYIKNRIENKKEVFSVYKLTGRCSVREIFNKVSQKSSQKAIPVHIRKIRKQDSAGEIEEFGLVYALNISD